MGVEISFRGSLFKRISSGAFPLPLGALLGTFSVEKMFCVEFKLDAGKLKGTIPEVVTPLDSIYPFPLGY